MHDPLSVVDVVASELDQRRESGYDVTDVLYRLAVLEAADPAKLEELYDRLRTTSRRPDWPYTEPESLPAILAAMPGRRIPRAAPVAEPQELSDRVLSDRVLGGWLGRIAGCNLGKPVENGTVWTPARIRAYLERHDAYPLRDYLPPPDPDESAALRECWPETTRGRIDGAARDDDIDYSILALHLVERHGEDLTPVQVGEALLAYLPYLRIFTAERATMVNLLHGVPAGRAADVRNPYREWIGALIRADVYGWVHPGRPEAAVRLAYADASLSHRANGRYGALWAAALVSLAVTADSVRQALRASLDWVPTGSRLAEALTWVVRLHERGCDGEQAIAEIHRRYGHYSWVHTVNNACLIAAGLLWGDGDYAATVGLTVQGGWDTDSNAATAGSVAGTVLGAAALPAHFVAPLHDQTRSAIFGFDHARISDLARRTTRLAEIDLGRAGRARAEVAVR